MHTSIARPDARSPLSYYRGKAAVEQALAVTAVLGAVVGDVMLTAQEIAGLCAGLLATDAPPLGSRRLTAWLAAHAGEVGIRYSNEVGRHYGVRPVRARPGPDPR